MSRTPITLDVNGRETEVWVSASQSLLDVLRRDVGATDVKLGCGEGVCGTCTVLLDGEPVNACLVFAVQAHGAHVTTAGGLATEASLHPLQEQFLAHAAAQCGFCTPGMLVTALWYLDAHPAADRDQIRVALSGNLCRCTGYTKILDAVEAYRDTRLAVPGAD